MLKDDLHPDNDRLCAGIWKADRARANIAGPTELRHHIGRRFGPFLRRNNGILPGLHGWFPLF